ncbi:MULTISPECIES: DNA phosphorothioation-associated putative methyltransferase [Rhizobium]|uniref:DNA phosphorothioation-associated putative methyltransferase n=1 Tax=Rhizobium aouanii TaxID=3118145 RepID=A0ABU8CJ53_9HYPH|nr:DNA phosphorothioation-associated putative methyltransferase [Rhizobium acaciae]MCW1410787.1 DNA phosphorothioation-associated putative methyltransferase [Rhizobium acaciae]MCW1742914.1 DNA phosphorothioation-associated putative methyltransferase [Rhizobium acaciae]MCW1750110.1 DNA phosphorothioation-associated putative methyltransferase [Rhizobium acaciae]
MAAGKKIGRTLYLHRDAIDALPDDTLRIVASAMSSGPPFEWNAVKLETSKLSLLQYQDFDAHAFPVLLRARTFKLPDFTFTDTDYSGRKNPPILHRKELLLAEGDARRPAFSAITALAERHDLFADAKRIGTREAWGRLVSDVGLLIDGPRLRHASFATVERHKTAITRYDLSAPVALMLKQGMLRPEYSMFDYGCGLGSDVAILTKSGYDAFGWDPAHKPDGIKREADIVNLGFVVNVIEDPRERADTLRSAWSYCRRGLCISAMLANQANVAGHTSHGDGYLTSIATFQKYYAQADLISWVSEVLGEQAVTLGNGSVACFKDKELEQEIRFARYSRISSASIGSMRLARTLRPLKAAREVPSAITSALWDLALSLGRVPTPFEVDPETSSIIALASLSPAAAIRSCVAGFDRAELEDAALKRREDMVVMAALSLFPGSPRYTTLPPSIRRSVRYFFGSHEHLLDEAREQLRALQAADFLAESFRSAVANGVATINESALSFGMVSEERLPIGIRLMLGCSELVSPGFSACDIVEIGPARGKLKGYVCSNMESPLPKISSRVVVDLARFSSHSKDFSDRVLYTKSRYMERDTPNLERQLSIETRLVAHGVVDRYGNGPEGRALSAMLKSALKR